VATVQFASQSSLDSDNKAANSSRLVNCYLEPVGGRAPLVMKSVLGMTSFATIPGVFARAATSLGSLIYAVQNSNLYTIDSGGTVTSLGTIADDVDTSISTNDGNITVVADGKYYLWDGSTLTQPTAGAFSDFGSVSYFGSLTVLTERNGNRVQWSDVYDPTTLDGLSFATADTYDGNILRAISSSGALWIMKDSSIERWYQTGADLAPVVGGALEFGLKDYNLVGKFPNGAFFVSSEGKVRLLSPTAEIISTRAVETSIAQNDPTNCFFYQDEGHDMCVIRFSDRPAWCYDFATKLWHERAEGFADDAWSAIGSVKAFDTWYVVTQTGPVYSLGRTNQDYGTPLIRQATSNTLQVDGNRFIVNRLEMQGRAGRADLGRDAKVMLEMSKDFGETFTDPKVRSIGDLGEYNQRLVWRRLGQFKQATARLSWSEPAEIPIDNIAMVDIG
jgi:hypothetical protein